MAESPKIRTHKINPLGQDPFLRLVWAVLTVLGWLLLFAFLMRLAGCGRPDAATADNGTYYGEPPVAPDDWIEVPPAVTDDWKSGGDWDAIVWDELPNADASDAIRDYWLEPPAQVVDLPEDAWEVDEDAPLGRKVASGIVNLYVTKESNLKGLSLQIAQAFPNTVLALASSADEYKRLTFEVEEDHKAYFKSRVRTVFPEVQFVFDESELTTATLESVILEGDDAWPWREIGAADLWKHTHGDSSIVVAVIDNMFETDHPELDGKQVSNWDVAGFDSEVAIEQGFWMDDESASHGTHVASLVAGTFTNGIGFGGLAPEARLMLIQLVDEEGVMTTSRIVDAMFYALNHGADVINLSLGTSFAYGEWLASMSLEEQALFAENYCIQEGEMWDELFQLFEEERVLVVQAAGNESYLAVIDPMKRTDATIIVGATSEGGDPAFFSNFGEQVDVYAPGDLIAGAGIDGKIVKMSGTSMAAPLVSGLVAALLSLEPDADMIRVKEALVASFAPGEARWKRVHAGRAAEYLLQNEEPNA